jgi:type III secretion protein L
MIGEPALRVSTALRGVRVLPPSAAAQLPLLVADVDSARARIARAEAERLALLDTVREQARQAGYRDGHAQAVRALAAFGARMQALAAGHDEALQALLLRALRRLLGELPADLLLAQLAAQALQAVRQDAGTVRVQVHPLLHAAVQQRLARLPSRPWRLEVHADARLGAADCRIETDFGAIDAALDTQLAALQVALAGGEPR